jgi:C-terminal processing protease CtpA/Prc
MNNMFYLGFDDITSIFLSLQTLDQAKDWLVKIFDEYQQILEEMNRLKGNKHYKKIEKMQEYIKLHYSDINLSVESLAEIAGYTSYYFSKIFKDITGMNVTGSIASMNSLPIGIYITQVQDNSPAFAAGIQTGDVITMVNGDSVLTFKALSDKLYNCKSGDAVIITVKRRQGSAEYKNMDFSVTLGDR